jgi:trimeric autotransporter adhesin
MSIRHPLQYKLNAIRTALRSPRALRSELSGSRNVPHQIFERPLFWTQPLSATVSPDQGRQSTLAPFSLSSFGASGVGIKGSASGLHSEVGVRASITSLERAYTAAFDPATLEVADHATSTTSSARRPSNPSMQDMAIEDGTPSVPVQSLGQAPIGITAQVAAEPISQATLYLKFANLQIAAERDWTTSVMSPEELRKGNDRSSKFTATAAEQFTLDWEVVEQRNTTSGFSGTLFRCKRPDAARGLIAGELVLCFRSTEFADDAARDNEATNEAEIDDHGWAFGQIDDMYQWYNELIRKGSLSAGNFTVTGYSLGGHLATAFNRLFGGVATATYTFNGAGVGEMLNGASLGQTVLDFHGRRVNGSTLDFKQSIVRQAYVDLRPGMNDLSTIEASDFQAAQERVNKAEREALWLLPPSELSQALTEIGVLRSAINQSQEIFEESVRINAGIFGKSGDVSTKAKVVPFTAIEAIKIDYQLAVHFASLNTKSTSSLIDWSRHQDTWWSGMVDIYGAAPPSAVANSQWHFGQASPVFIEDQPLVRGNLLGFFWESLASRGIKLLTDNFSENDFGDTHSLVLLVDSLAVQDALTRLQPTLTFSQMGDIFSSSSADLVSELPFTQGQCDGKALEGVLDSLRLLLVSPTASPTPASTVGGTWAELQYRNPFHANLAAVAGTSAPGQYTNPQFAALAGKATLSADFEGSPATTDFASLASLSLGTTFQLRTTDTDAMAKLGELHKGTADNPGIYTQWQADTQLRASGGSSMQMNFTDQWLTDRAGFLNWSATFNQLNIGNNQLLKTPATTQSLQLIDKAKGKELSVLSSSGTSDPAFLVFGSDAAETLDGGALSDRLYGQNGNDTLRGNGGNDWLEGNAGADSLLGDAGRDVLLGGSGDDVLRGGLDMDFMLGGADTDTYVQDLGDGLAEVQDQDGLGKLQIAGYETGLPSLMKVSDSVWRSADEKVTVSKVASEVAGKSHLVIAIAGRQDVVVVRDWQEGELGITLGSNALAAPVTTALFKGDQRAWIIGVEVDQDTVKPGDPSYGNYKWSTTTWLPGSGGLTNARTVPGWSDVIAASAGRTTTTTADKMEGLLGNDALDGGDANDVVDGGDGDDLLAGGKGSDWIMGGAGRDYVVSGDTLAVNRQINVNDPKFQAPPGGVLVYGGDTWGLVRWTDPDKFDYTIFGVSSGATSSDGDVVWAGTGDDRVIGSHGADLLFGEQENDIVWGRGGSDQVIGGIGDDFLGGDGIAEAGYVETTPSGLHGQDFLDGGAGNDTLNGHGGSDQLFGGEGNDDLWGESSATAYAQGDDYLDGGAGDDTLQGGGGSDVLRGGAHQDLMFGDFSDAAPTGQGNDYMDGGSGNDSLIGYGGSDELIGDIGNDVLDGDGLGSDAAGHGSDTIRGGAGSDTLWGGGGNDTLEGGTEGDVLVGDYVATELGSQWHGKDLLLGGAGNDVLYGCGGDDALYGGDGNDWVSGEDQSGSNAVTTQTGNDWLEGGAGNDTLLGGNGDDTLSGGSGYDVAFGGKGRDVYRFSIEDIPKSAQLVSMGQMRNTIAAEATEAPHRDVGPAALEGAMPLVSSGGVLVGGTQFSISVPPSMGTWLGDHSGAEAGDNSPASGVTTVQVATAFLPTSFSMPNPLGTEAITIGTSAWDEDGGSVYEFNTIVVSADTNADGNLTLALGGFNSGTYINLNSAFFRRDQTIVAGGETQLLRDWVQGSFYQAVNLTTEGSEWAYAFGGAGNDSLTGSTASDELEGGEGNDVLLGKAGDDTLKGGGGNDYLFGDSGNNLLEGGAGDDSIDSGEGQSTLIGGLGNDLIEVGNNDVVKFGIGDGTDRITRSASGLASNTLMLGEGLSLSDLVFQRINPNGAVWMRDFDDLKITIMSTGDSIYIHDFTAHDSMQPNAASPISQVTFSDGSKLSWGQILAQSMIGTTGADTLIGTDGGDILNGHADNDIIHGKQGKDTIYGGLGNDTIVGGGVSELKEEDQLFGEDGDDHISAATRGAFVDGGNGNDRITAEIYSARVLGGAGNDLIYINGYDWKEGDNIVSVDAGIGNDRVRIPINPNNVPIEVQATDGNDAFFLAANTWLAYRKGDDRDTLGQDEYVQWFGVRIDASIASSSVTKKITRSGSLLDFGNGDSLEIKGVFTGRSWSQNENGIIDFASGADWTRNDLATWWGTSASDSYTAGAGNDILVGEFYGGGVYGHDFLNGGAGNDGLLGGIGADTLLGGLGDDTLSGGEDGYADVLDGGLGNDHYYVEVGDIVVEYINSGTDTVYLDYQPFMGGIYNLQENIENLVVDGNDSISVKGNDLNNHMTGSIGWDTLNGGAGSDTLIGGDGSDTYIVDSLLDVVIEEAISTRAAEGFNDPVPSVGLNDTVQSSVNWTLGANLEELLLLGSATEGRGNSLANKLTGNVNNNLLLGFEGHDTLLGMAGTDTLDGGLGNDLLDPGIGGRGVLTGGLGSDTYVFKRGYGEVVINATVDTDSSKVDVLSMGADIASTDVLLFAEGNKLSIAIIGATDVVTVNDFFAGGSPHHSANPLQRIDFADRSSWGYTEIQSRLQSGPGVGSGAANRLMGTALADRLYGLGGNDTLEGLAGNDTLDGGLGVDSLMGGQGNDTYLVQDGKDIVVEQLNEGTDTVLSSVNWVLGNNTENLTLLNSVATNATGNTQANVLTGNQWANVVKGNAGNDTLVGLEGNDSLDGGTGNDLLQGGSGDDTYTVNASGDVIVEAANEGEDTVSSSSNWTLGDNLEKLVLTGTKALKGTGNDLSNWLTGATANDTLLGMLGNDSLFGMAGNDSLSGGDGWDFIDGGLGVDTMVGGLGADSYFIDESSDVVIETNTEYDSDIVFAAASYTLSANIENLTLTGAGNIQGTGNDGHNVLTGNLGNNVLTGGAGHDTLNGGGGNDTLSAGLGNDTYLWGDANSQVLVTNFDQTIGRIDRLQVSQSLNGQFSAQRLANNDLILTSIDGLRKVTVQGYFEMNGTSGKQVDWIDIVYDNGYVASYSVADVISLLPFPNSDIGASVVLPVSASILRQPDSGTVASPGGMSAERAQSLIEANQQLVLSVQSLGSSTTEASNSSTTPTWRGWDWRAAERGLWDADGTADQRVGLPWYIPRPEYSSVDLGPTDSEIERAEEAAKPVITRVTSPIIERAAALNANHQRLLEAMASFNDGAAVDTGLASTPWAWERPLMVACALQ